MLELMLFLPKSFTRYFLQLSICSIDEHAQFPSSGCKNQKQYIYITIATPITHATSIYLASSTESQHDCWIAFVEIVLLSKIWILQITCWLITLPNGFCISVDFIGDFVITISLLLRDVLFVHSSPLFNLVSVSCLLQHGDIFVDFFC